MPPEGPESSPSPIMIIDEQVELVRELLHRKFFPVAVIGHSISREAAEQLSRQRPALLICDLHMPQVGGVNLLTLARQRWVDLPMVILIGGMGLSSDEYAQVGRDTIYLQKPFRLGTLCACITELAVFPPGGRKALESARARSDLRASVSDEDCVTPPGGSATPPSALQPAQDFSLSTETPLPPPSPRPLDEPGERMGLDELWEILDEEIEIIEHQKGPRSPGNNQEMDEGETAMALTTNNIKDNLVKLEGIEGFIGVALADSDSGMCLGSLGGGGVINLEVAAAANTEVVRAKRKAIKSLSLRDEIEDILISLGKQYHLIRPVRTRPTLFFYLVLDRQRSNLAMARFTLADAERDLPM